MSETSRPASPLSGSIQEVTEESTVGGDGKRLGATEPSSSLSNSSVEYTSYDDQGRSVTITEDISPDMDLPKASESEAERLADKSADDLRDQHAQERLAEVRVQVNSLFDKFVATGKESSASGNVSHELSDSEERSQKTILSRDLPVVLEEFERQRGFPVIDAWLVPQLEALVKENPDLPISPEFLVKMIIGLEGAAPPSDDNMDSNDGEADHISNPTADHHSSDFTSSDEDDRAPRSYYGNHNPDDSREEVRFPTLVQSSPPPTIGAFPRSRSDFANLSTRGSSSTLIQPRKITNSDPSDSPFAAGKRSPSSRARSSTPIETSPSRSKRDRKSSGNGSEDKEVLRGKGKQRPPSAWTKPRPLALAQRARRISDSSTGSIEGIGKGSFDSDHHPRRPRQVSQPVSGNESAPWSSGIPRSFSSGSATGYQFPRATSPTTEVNWQGWGGSSSSRGASPGVDETSYQPFSALSPSASNRPGSALGHGSPGGSRYAPFDSHGADESIVRSTKEELLVAEDKIEQLQRLVAEKQRRLSGIQDEHEEAMYGMQTELDELKSEVHFLKKEEKETKASEKELQVQIATFEQEIAQLQRQLEAQKSSYARLKRDYDDQCEASEKLRDTLREKSEELRVMKEDQTQLSAHVKEWEREKKEHESAIQQLRRDLEGSSETLEALTEQKQVNSVLQETIDRLKFELDEARRPSSGFTEGRNSSQPPSLSKRLGNELAKHFVVHEQNEEEDEDALGGSGSETEAEIDQDRSVDSIVETVIRRRKRISRKTAGVQLISTGTQTESDGMAVSELSEHGEEASGSSAHANPVDAAPPTYNEAALEKEILARCHPAHVCVEATATDPPNHPPANKDSKLVQVAYEELSRGLGTRCLFMEQTIKQKRSETDVETSTGDEGEVRKREQGSTSPSPDEGTGSNVVDIRVKKSSGSLAIVTFAILGLAEPWTPRKRREGIDPWSTILFLTGILLGLLLFRFSGLGESHHYYHFGLGGAEDGSKMIAANSLGLPFGWSDDHHLARHGLAKGRDVEGRLSILAKPGSAIKWSPV
ncbi:hypothetical protein IE53DRAFT_43617 [Violaceomyces palustris]|uniref:Uncharacterized protein n=1 Tax=Violaceomyces palustris TaxID=1673888 RepID=A0ACD0P0I8_9BASI|nr:hypothetical protein IE53DRAFT_43617 [Violaceomyces palustris]